MITNKILEIILAIISIVVIPIQILTTLILGILIRLSFGLLLIPLSFIWTVCILFPLLGLSYIYEKTSILRIPVALIGIPIAITGNTFSALIPSMGEIESRVSKLLITECFPYSWHCYQLTLKNPLIEFTHGYSNLLTLLNRVKINDKLRWQYVNELKTINNI